jgi:hypothetical protein
MASYVNSEGIQSGWIVWSSDGQELGTVIGTDQTMIRIKKGGLLRRSSWCRARRSRKSRRAVSSST